MHLVVFANLITHPAVWFIFTQLFLVGTPEYVVTSEAWAVGLEALFYSVTMGPHAWPRLGGRCRGQLRFVRGRTADHGASDGVILGRQAIYSALPLRPRRLPSAR